jgi:hypothetical protein
MNPGLASLAVLAVGVATWFALYGIVRLVTLPARPAAASATPELGDEPPALVNLLVNRWDLTRDAHQATLLDLAARGYVELRAPGDVPARTTVRPTGMDPVGLTDYERRVLDRVVGLAGRGGVPLTGLSFRTEAEAEAWLRRLHGEIVVDARHKGLSRRRFGPFAAGFLAVAGIAIGIAMPAGYIALGVAKDDDGELLVSLLVVGLALAVYGLRYPGERDTPAGRAAASHWLGVRASLRQSQAITHLPPAASVHWGRNLAYGAALGVARLAGSVLDLGLGSRNLVWSEHGGSWHRVRVQYPTRWPAGRTAGDLAAKALLWLAIGVGLIAFHGRPREWLTEFDPQLIPAEVFDIVELVIMAVGVALLAIGGYAFVRTLVDLGSRCTVTGEVLWLEAWSGCDGLLAHLAIDDGTGDRTVAWLVPIQQTAQCRAGDTVRITAYPWTRHVSEFAVVARSRRPVEPGGDVDLDRVMSARAGDRVAAGALRAGVWIERAASWLQGSPYRRAPRPAADLLTAGDVTRALGVTVRGPTVLPGRVGLGFSDDQGRVLLVLSTAGGLAARLAWPRHARGTALAGVGRAAFVQGDRGAVRVKGAMLVLSLYNRGRNRPAALKSLLTTAAGRLPALR